MGTGRAKQFLDLGGRPMLAVTLEAFQECRAVDRVILVAPSADVGACREIVDTCGLTKVEEIVPGGTRRQDSVRLGLEASGGQHATALVHDGVRPLVSRELLERMLDASREHRAVIAALPAKETVKAVDRDRMVSGTYHREEVWLVQTPQVFRFEDIAEAHERAFREGWEGITDDAMLMERMGVPVRVVEGLEENIKVTTPYDLELARFFLRKRSGVRR
jgi:2-C-methyl-D-erythritol 4-phosphate cytidylyltransferase